MRGDRRHRSLEIRSYMVGLSLNIIWAHGMSLRTPPSTGQEFGWKANVRESLLESTVGRFLEKKKNSQLYED